VIVLVGNEIEQKRSLWRFESRFRTRRGGGRPCLDYKIEQHFGDQTEVEFDGWGNGTPASLA
jgi:hypothetical protein